MKKNLLFFALGGVLSTHICFAQEEPEKRISLSAGLGVLTFNGDIGKGNGVSSYTYIRAGYQLNAEKCFAKDRMGVSLNFVTGKIAMSERSTTVARNHNFESAISQAGVNVTAYFQNKKKIPLIPFVTTGFSYAFLKTKTDIKYKGDSLYYYWSDGSIRNLPELPANQVISHQVTRDYIYETPLANAVKNTTTIPVGIGVKMKAGTKIEAIIGLTYHLSFSDEIDGIKGGGKDNYLFSYFSIVYNLFKKANDPAKEKDKLNVDFASIDQLDLDKDGVKDINDKCPDTPEGVPVDGVGCPLDTDGDGVPDYLDKEANTKKNSLVNAEGKTVTDAMILEKAKRDSLSTTRTTSFMAHPSSATLNEFDAEIKNKQPEKGNPPTIPEQFLSADINQDGVISSSEITKMIEGFFDGSNDYTVTKINALIDYFFEQ